jgi:hypothetical protein
MIAKSYIDRLSPFTRAYLSAMAFTEDPNPPQGDYPAPDLQRQFAPDVLDQARLDCERFEKEYGDLIADDPEQAGRDFWYTRNGHGCGFWDGDWPEPAATVLTDASHACGEVYVEFRRGKFRAM